MTRFPTKDDYLRAVQDPSSFTSTELRRAEFVPNPRWEGIPFATAGSSAVVFRAVMDGREKALRFPTRAETSTKERYDALYEHFTGTSLAPVVAMPRWVDDAIRVDGHTWPMVRMEWADGRVMHEYVEQLVEVCDIAALAALAERWLDLVGRLQAAHFAHGDLQHGNVLVDEHGALRLVDFDCSWIERFAGQPPPAETGHVNYQPANRPWGRWMDTFPGLVVYLSLLTLSRNPAPWPALNTGDNLLFRREDFQPPFQTRAWAHLASVGDPQLDQLSARLRECCVPGWTADGGLLELLAPRHQPWWEVVSPVPSQVPSPVPSSAPPSAAPPLRADPAPPGEWWHRLQPGPPASPPPSDEPTGPGVLRGLVVALVFLALFIALVLVAAAR